MTQACAFLYCTRKQQVTKQCRLKKGILIFIVTQIQRQRYTMEDKCTFPYWPKKARKDRIFVLLSTAENVLKFLSIFSKRFQASYLLTKSQSMLFERLSEISEFRKWNILWVPHVLCIQLRLVDCNLIRRSKYEKYFVYYIITDSLLRDFIYIVCLVLF